MSIEDVGAMKALSAPQKLPAFDINYEQGQTEVHGNDWTWRPFARRQNRENKLADVPEWYLIARSARPQLSQHADALLYEIHKRERGLREKTSYAQRWVDVERQITDQMRAELDALVTLQKHVNTFTVCDPEVIAGLFAGLETEEERLAVVLASHVKFPDTQFRQSSDQEEAADCEDDDANDGDESVILYGPEELKADKKRRRTEKRRRREENLKKHKEGPAPEATTQTKKPQDGGPARQPNERQRQTDRERSKRSQAPEPEPSGQASRSASQREN